ncbi:hypothetical protein N7520_002043 [Penicillium odoratum]|uniref:uncharacterized protein n=1 Tax=Penicillium odoratum TaxID=1167516 RepID=UPI002548A2E3|nr:uncharacterized protein N7520_002043 [Penicillium odoratum]KAJ5778797.1 hypothetical protein N7520_002043 [Penicillium odoratum]
MSGLDISLALPGVIDLCLKYGKVIITAYRDFNHAEEGIEERRISVDAAWAKTSEQLAFLRRVWDNLDENYRALQGRILRNFQKKLEEAVIRISDIDRSVGKSAKFEAGKYALKKQSLDKAIQDLQNSQHDFDTTWYLVLLMADRFVDDGLVRRAGTEKLSTARHVRDSLNLQPGREGSVFLPGDKLRSAKRSDIPHATSQIVEIPGVGTVIIDSADCSSRDDAHVFAKDVRTLATRLRQVDDNSFHLLKCYRVARMTELQTERLLSFDFMFYFPKGCSRPQSLRSHLLSQANHSLGDRIKLAQQLAAAVNYIHILDFVHKNIRPETILIFESDGNTLGPLYLLGFRAFRLADNKTLRLGNSVWSENIYQHPDRQGIHPSTDYVMQHDIYSLGVCLLEIGLWGSLVSSKGYAGTLLTESGTSNMVQGTALKDHYTTLAKEQLPSRMGARYTAVVVNCLSCMDGTNEDFGDKREFEDDDGILIGVKYIEKIILLLSEITV